MFSHVKTNEDSTTNSLHFSHLFRYVSAYEYCDGRLFDLKQALLEGLRKAKKLRSGVMVDQDGEHFFVCNPNGSFDLCVRWKSYTIVEESKKDE